MTKAFHTNGVVHVVGKYLLIYTESYRETGNMLLTNPPQNQTVPTYNYEQFETLTDLKKYINEQYGTLYSSDGSTQKISMNGRQFEPIRIFEISREINYKKKEEIKKVVEEKTERRFLGWEIE